MLAPPAPRREPPASLSPASLSQPSLSRPSLASETPVASESPAEPPAAAVELEPTAAQDNSPVVTLAPEPAPVAAPAPTPPLTEPPQVTAAPLFRARQDLRNHDLPKHDLPKHDVPRATPSSVPPVIPILRAPDDPGIDDEANSDEFAEQTPPTSQTGGWRGFLSRWGS
jgi:HemY protein